jgi:outer membrane protein TolC
MAAGNSLALKAYDEKLASALATEKSDRRALLPQLSASGEEGYSVYDKASGLSDGMNGRAGVQLSWDLPKVLSGYPRLSRLEAEKAAASLALARKALARDVAKDYYQLHILLGKKTDYAAAEDYFRSHIGDIESLGDKGLDVKLDLIRTGIQLKSLEVSAADINTQLHGALISLASAVGRNLSPLDLPFTDIPSPAAGGLYADTAPAGGYPQGSAAALLTRLDALELNTSLENYRQSAYAWTPQLAAGLDRAITPIDPATERYRTYLTASLPIFDFGLRAENRKSLKSAGEYQRSLNGDNARQLALSIAGLNAEMKNAASSCAAAEANLNGADESLETARDYYRQGKIKETDLLSIFSEYLAVKEQARDALGLFLEKKADLDYLLGE